MSLPELLASRMGERSVVVGIGNPHRGDDAVGCLVARSLREIEAQRGPLGLAIVETEEVPESYLGPILRPSPDLVILVDAVEMGEDPGTVALLETGEMACREASTHRAPLSLLAHYIGSETGADVLVLGVQPGARDVDGPPSPAIREAASVLAQVLEAAAILARIPGTGREEAPC